ncbi:MAG: hypothetical protein LIO96_00715 [Lachnospiraceae bacterium]|nr:hypothetical protein [Lachnospiraceae bacterium]
MDFAKSRENPGYIKNLEVCSYQEMDRKSGMFQMQIYKTEEGKYYLYGSCFGGTRRGIMINEVTDPYHPVFHKYFQLVDPEEYPSTSTPKIQVADDLLIAAMAAGGLPDADEIDLNVKCQVGIRIYSLKKDPLNPEFLGYWDCGVPHSAGVHRFMYNGGRYVHLSSYCQGFDGYIYRIIDIEDPCNPKEVGRWWDPSQYVNGYPGRAKDYDPTKPFDPEFMDKPWLHGPAFVVGDKAYLGYAGAGLYVLDVADVTQPKCLDNLKFMPAFSSHFAGARTHTALPIIGRDLVVVTNEGERFQFYTKEDIGGMAQAMNNLHMVDVRDPARPTLIAEFPYPEVPENFPYKNFNDMGLGCHGPFGPHNLHEPMDGKPWLEMRTDRVYCCYFHAGLRIYDISDPYYIKELAYFIPPNPDKKKEESLWPFFEGPRNAVTEDCIVDDRGFIIVTCLDDGFYILKQDSSIL